MMTEQTAALSAAHIKYLLALRALSADGRGIRSVAIASVLGVSKASVHTMMHTLRDMEIIDNTQYGSVFLTESGRLLSEEYGRYYDAVSRYLAPVLPVETDRSASVCAFLAAVPPRELEELCRNIERRPDAGQERKGAI